MYSGPNLVSPCVLFLRLIFPRAKYDRAKKLGEELGEFFGRNFLAIFVLHLLCRMTHQNFSPNSSQFITLCLVAAPVTKKVLWLKSQNFISASFWGLGHPTFFNMHS